MKQRNLQQITRGQCLVPWFKSVVKEGLGVQNVWKHLRHTTLVLITDFDTTINKPGTLIESSDSVYPMNLR